MFLFVEAVAPADFLNYFFSFLVENAQLILILEDNHLVQTLMRGGGDCHQPRSPDSKGQHVVCGGPRSVAILRYRSEQGSPRNIDSPPLFIGHCNYLQLPRGWEHQKELDDSIDWILDAPPSYPF